MTYEQELRRLYELLTAADSQVLTVLELALDQGSTRHLEYTHYVAEYINKAQSLVRELIPREERGA